MITVTKRFSFEACHHLPYYKGACHNIHGHSYKLDVTVGGEVIEDKNNEKCGMIIDFKDLKEIVNRVVNHLDHSNLNEYFENPTAENIAKFICDNIPNCVKVTVQESEGNVATYER